jgi:hypothetical protein
MPRNGPQPGEGELERSVTTTENESTAMAESARGIAQRDAPPDTMFAALLFDLCRDAHDPIQRAQGPGPQ